MDSSAAAHFPIDVPRVLIEVMRLHAGPYLSDENLKDAIRSVDFPHIGQLLASMDELPVNADPVTILEMYLDDERAVRVGPNCHFDEAFYQLEYLDVRTSVKAGHLHCGFFHYIKYGLREGRWPNRSIKHTAMHKGQPLPLVEDLREAVYIALNPGAAAFLESFPFLSPLAHYNALGRKLHLRLRPEQQEHSRIDKMDIIYSTIRSNFDPVYYKDKYLPKTARSDDDFLSHYIQHAGKCGYSPNAWFDEEFYCAFYKEAREAVEAGNIMSGFYHYVVTGSAEGRIPKFDLKRVLDLRMPGVTTPTLLHRTEDIRRRGELLGAAGRFRRIPKRVGKPVAWFLLPTINPDITFGGYRAAFELIIAMHDAGYGIAILCTEDEEADKRYFLFRERSEKLRAAFSDIPVFNRKTLIDEQIAEDDIILTYSVWDLHIASEIAGLTKRPLAYLLAQEYEPIFYDNSSIRVMCESRYDIPHFPIINSRMLETYLRLHQVGVFKSPDTRGRPRHAVFEHKINRLQAGTPTTIRGRKERLLALYARPEGHAARNLFEIAILALQAACAGGDFGSEWRFIGLGALSEAPPIVLGGGHTMHLMQKMSEAEYVDYMRALDIGVSLMFAPHPSVVPFEFASTGALVVTNTYENRSADELTAICGNFVPCGLSIEQVRLALQKAIARVDNAEERCANIFNPPFESWEAIFSPAFIGAVFGREKEATSDRHRRPIERRLRFTNAYAAVE